MKKSILFIFCLTLTLSANSQKLLDIYKKGTIKLIPDTEYAKDINWNQVFRSYKDTMMGKHIGARKSLVIMPDGSVVVNHAYTNYYTMFSPQGKFVKEFGIKNAKSQQLKKINGIEGIINNNTFFTGLDNLGYMNCFDFNGNRIKTMRLNYMTRQMLALPNNKIAVVGWVIWKDKFRDFVSIVDYATNNEKVIWEYYTDRSEESGEHKLFYYTYSFKTGGMISYSTNSNANVIGLNSPPILACVDKKLIVSVPTTGEILIYDLEGNLNAKDKVSWPVKSISVNEQKEEQKECIEKLRSKHVFNNIGFASKEEVELARETMANEMEADLNRIKDPLRIPAFSTIIKDSDGNLLFFEYLEKGEGNKFNVWVYEKGGNFVCQSSFACDDYDLNINPSRMAFRNGYLYSLQESKNATGIPMRLVRFKLTTN